MRWSKFEVTLCMYNYIHACIFFIFECDICRARFHNKLSLHSVILGGKISEPILNLKSHIAHEYGSFYLNATFVE